MLSARLAWGPVRGICADGVLCSLWSSSVVIHSFHCSCFNLHFISLEHPIALLLECGEVEPQGLCTRSKGREESALQSSPAHCSHAGRQLRLFPRLSSLPAQDDPRQHLGRGCA